jgi:hypothetical protein
MGNDPSCVAQVLKVWKTQIWIQPHSAVSADDFVKDASRNRIAVLLSRTNHLSYRLGQAVLAVKGDRA